MALKWSQIASLQGQKGDTGAPGAAGASTPQTLPDDLTPNSVNVAPVSGDNKAVAITLGNGTQTLFSINASGQLAAAASAIAGNATIGGTESVTGLLTALGNVLTPLVSTTQTPTTATIAGTSYNVSNVQWPGTFGDNSSAYPKSGISSDAKGNLTVNYQGQPVIQMSNPGYNASVGTTPASAFPTVFKSGSYQFAVGAKTQLGISASEVRFGYSSNTLPVTMQSLSGNILVLQNSGTAPSYNPSTVGSVDTSGNLSLSGSATTAGTVQASALTISASGGALTFGDGTTQTTASSGASGPQSSYSATANGTASAPAYSFTNQTNTGVYLATQSTSAAVLGLTVNGTQTFTTSKTATSVAGTLTSSGSMTSSSHITTNTGSQTAPTYAFSSSLNTGFWCSATPTLWATVSGQGCLSINPSSVNSVVPLTAGGTFGVTGATTLSSTLAVTGATTLSSTLAVTGATTLKSTTSAAGTVTSTTAAGTPSFVSSQGFKVIGPTFYYWANGNATPTTPTQMSIAIVATSGTQTSSFTLQQWVATRAGSVTGLSVGFDRSNTQSFLFRLNIAGTQSADLITTSSNTQATFAKGTYAFTAGQTVSIMTYQSSSSTTATAVISAHFEVELPA